MLTKLYSSGRFFRIGEGTTPDVEVKAPTQHVYLAAAVDEEIARLESARMALVHQLNEAEAEIGELLAERDPVVAARQGLELAFNGFAAKVSSSAAMVEAIDALIVERIEEAGL